MDNKQQMKEDFAAAVRAIGKSVRPWRIATAILSLVVAILAIALVLK